MVVFVLLFAMTVLTGFSQAQEQTFTGCMSENGKIKNVTVGDEPLKPCKENQVEVSWAAVAPLNNIECPQGQSVTGFDANGLPVCDCFAPFDPVPDEVDALATEYWSINGVSIDGGSNVATVAPGASFSVGVQFYQVLQVPGCAGCIIQLQLGYADFEPEPCFFSGFAPANGVGVTAFTAPMEPGVYYIEARRTLELSCLPTWEDTFPPDFLKYKRYPVAAICVK
jgi:hypothetical protein